MNISLLDRYIGIHILSSALLALALLVILFSVIDLVDDLDSVGVGFYTAFDALWYQILLAPGRAFSMLPIAALIGSLFGLGLLASRNELTAFRVAGVSVGRIVSAVLKSGALLVLFAMALSEWVIPITEQRAEAYRSVALGQTINLHSQYGLWMRDGTTFIKVRRILPSGDLEDISVHEFDAERKLKRSWQAEVAQYHSSGWQLRGVRQSVFVGNTVVTHHMNHADWQMDFGPEHLNAIIIEPERLSTVGLIRYLSFLQSNGLNSSRYELALWNKFTYPLLTGALIFLSVVSVLGVLRSVTLGYRLFVGMLAGVGFHIFQKISMHTGVVFDINPGLSVLTPILFCLVLGYLMLRKVN